MIKDGLIPPVKRGGRTIAVCAVIAVLLVSMAPATVAASAHNSHKLGASFTAPCAAIAGQPVTVKAWASGGTPPYTYAWTTSDGQKAAGQQVKFTAPNAKSFTVTLTVTDSAQKTATFTKTINVKTSTTLKAAFTFDPVNPSINRPVTFDASTSTGTIVKYEWSFGDGSPPVSGSDQQRVEHTYTAAGIYTVRLTVADANGAVGTSQQVTVAATPPTLKAAFTFDPVNPSINRPVTFDASTSTGTIVKYEWQFGDGNKINSATPLAQNTYAQAGTYTVTLTVTDKTGQTAQVVRAVQVL